MRTLKRTILAVMTMCVLSFAQITSNGTGGGDWNTGTTWNGGSVPTSTDDVVVLTGDSVRLVAAGSCAQLTLQSGAKLALNATGLSVPGTSWSFDNNSTVYFNGPTTVQSAPTYGNLVYMSANGGPNGDITINGNLTVTTATFRGIAVTSGTRTVTVGGNIYITGTGARISAVNNSAATTASCTYNITGGIYLTGANSGNRMVCYESAGPHSGSAVFNIGGDLSIGTSSQVSIKSSTSTTNNFPEGVINLKGNLVHNGVISILSVSSGTSPGLSINFIGTSAQTWSGTGTYDTRIGFPINFKVNNSAGVTLGSPKTLSAIASASITLTLTNGTLTTTNTNLLTMGANATLSGGSSSSFINGPMSHTWTAATETKVFPLGKGSTYRPLEIALTTPASPVIRAEVFNANPGGSSSLDRISIGRYYQTSLVSGTAASGGTVKITYGADDGVQNSGTLVVAQSSTVNGSYATLGNSASDASSVTSSSYNPANGDFLVLGSTGSNTLPVEISSFTATPVRGAVELRWSTATEVNNKGFEVEKQQNGSWSTLGFVAGAGTSNEHHAYSYTDQNAKSAAAYRLKQIDNDGAVHYSAVVNVQTSLTAAEFGLSQNYPNPFNPSTSFTFAVRTTQKATVKVYDMLGKEVASLFNGIAEANQLYSLKFDASHLPSGIYFYALQGGGRTEIKKMTLMK